MLCMLGVSSLHEPRSHCCCYLQLHWLRERLLLSVLLVLYSNYKLKTWCAECCQHHHWRGEVCIRWDPRCRKVPGRHWKAVRQSTASVAELGSLQVFLWRRFGQLWGSQIDSYHSTVLMHAIWRSADKNHFTVVNTWAAAPSVQGSQMVYQVLFLVCSKILALRLFCLVGPCVHYFCTHCAIDTFY